MKTLKEKSETALKPLYEGILKDLDKEKNTAFVMQLGDKFPEEENKGIIFVGRALNGSDNKQIFEELSTMGLSWMQDCKKDKDSQFIRVVKDITRDIYRADDNSKNNKNWHKNIAWSNLYKVSPKDKGNPSKELKEKYKDKCITIFEKEIEILSPKIIILLTGWTWAKPFLLHLNNNEKLNESQILERKIWDENKNYYAKAINIKDIIYILSEHPQGKIEDEHVKAIIELIHKYK